MNSTNNECTPCPRGTYSDTGNADSCSSCPEGLTTSQEGSEQTSQCTGGTFILNLILNSTISLTGRNTFYNTFIIYYL